MIVNVIEQMANVTPGSAAADAMAARAALLQASQDNYAAVLTPKDPGGLSHAERFRLAAHIARLSGDGELASTYAQSAGGYSAGSGIADPRTVAIMRHVDLVTCTPRAATANDIVALQSAGVTQADIVRLSQLIAFVSYQVRVIAGLRLMASA